MPESTQNTELGGFIHEGEYVFEGEYQGCPEPLVFEEHDWTMELILNSMKGG